MLENDQISIKREIIKLPQPWCQQMVYAKLKVIVEFGDPPSAYFIVHILSNLGKVFESTKFFGCFRNVSSIFCSSMLQVVWIVVLCVVVYR